MTKLRTAKRRTEAAIMVAENERREEKSGKQMKWLVLTRIDWSSNELI